MEKFIRELSSIIPLPNFEGLEVRAPIQYHFAIRVQWDNPNGTVGCILQYAKVAPYLYRTVHEDTNVAGYEFIVSNELPDELPPATLPPCPD